MSDEVGALYLRDALERLRAHKKLGDRAISQVY